MMKRLLKQLWYDEDGQSMTEYMLMLFIVVMIAVKFKGLFMGKIESLFGQIGNKMDEAVQ